MGGAQNFPNFCPRSTKIGMHQLYNIVKRLIVGKIRISYYFLGFRFDKECKGKQSDQIENRRKNILYFFPDGQSFFNVIEWVRTNFGAPGIKVRTKILSDGQPGIPDHLP